MSPAEGLRVQLQCVLSENPTRAATRHVLSLCHRMARSYLRHKRPEAVPTRLACDSRDDLALDMIAGLFQRDEEGRFVELRRYFDGVDVPREDERVLLTALRRLLFSHVNDALFAAYRRNDPVLGRIVRNIKLVADDVEGVTVAERRGDRWIHFAEDVDFRRPLLPPELLTSYLVPAVRDGTSTREVLHAAAQYVRTQHVYRCACPVMMLARAYRDATRHLSRPIEQEHEEPAHDSLRSGELLAMLVESVDATRQVMQASYVGSGKMDVETFDRYFEAIRDRLCTEYIDRNEGVATNYEALRRYVKGLSLEDYSAEHRSVFEYLSRRTREDFLGSVERVIS